MTVPVHKSGFRWTLHLFAVVGFCLLVLILGGVVALFVVEIEDVIYADGKIVSELPFDIISHVDGRVIRLNFEEGADVRAGEVIAQIDSMQYEEEYVAIESAIREYEAERDVKAAELAALKSNPLPKELWYAETNLRETEERAKRTGARLIRLQRLRSTNAISQKEFEDTEIENIKTQAEVARARENFEKVKSGLGEKNIEKARRDIALVQAKIDGRRAALKLAARHLDDCRIVAPSDGRLVSIPCKFTMYVEKGKVVAKMSSGKEIHGLAYVNEGVVRKVRPGQKVRISSGVFNRLEFGSFEGTVERVYDTPEEGQQNAAGTKYPVEIRIEPRGRKLKLGSTAEFAIVAGREPVIYSFLGMSREDFQRRRAEREALKKKL